MTIAEQASWCNFPHRVYAGEKKGLCKFSGPLMGQLNLQVTNECSFLVPALYLERRKLGSEI
jgi:hypothetical protein